jgi:translation initiation factor eIF-2B subunit delta
MTMATSASVVVVPPSSSTPNEAAAAIAAETSTTEKSEKKAKAANIVIPPKKPKLNKAERRALQESQRAAKVAGGGTAAGQSKGGGGERGVPRTCESGTLSTTSGVGGGDASVATAVKRGHSKSITDDEKKESHDAPDDRGGVGTNRAAEDKMVSLFSHLPRPKSQSSGMHHHLSSLLSSSSSSSSSTMHFHPAIPTLGHLYLTHSLIGGNARCRAMLQTFALLLRSYTPPSTSRDFRHDIDHSLLKPAFQCWTTQCRPHSVSMGNAFSFLKLAVANLDRDTQWDVARDILLESMEAYVNERIEYAGKAISRHAGCKIQDIGDVILIFGKSEVINRLLLDAALVDKKIFRVIVVDSRPMLEGRDTLSILSRAGISCTYVLLNALSYLMMREVTKVFLGASALMSNGSVLSRVGTACVALLATERRIPVLVGCETYKICNRVQLESITGNELGDADEVACTDCAKVGPSNRWDDGPDSGGDEKKNEEDVLSGWKDQPNLKLLSLMYDLTPSDFVTGIVTEVGILPPSSVAVLLREMSPESAFTETS